MGKTILGVLVASVAFAASGCSRSQDTASDAVPPTEPPASSATSTSEAPASAEAVTSCTPPRVRYTPYPGGDESLSEIPWIRGEPNSAGLVGLLWYWPEEWQRQRLREARIFTGGTAPAGYNTKVMWVFLAEAAKGRGGETLVVEGRRLDGDGAFRQEFAAIGYAGQEGAPSYASIIDVPEQGCWRLQLSTGELRAQVDLLAVEGGQSQRIAVTRNSGSYPPGCGPGEVATVIADFFEAFNEGDTARLDRSFDREPKFQWYSVTEGVPEAGGRHFVTYERSRLLPYFVKRREENEHLRLLMVDIGFDARAAHIGYVLERQADDLASLGINHTIAHGKGAIDCSTKTIFAWSMGMPKEPAPPGWACPRPTGWTPGDPAVACTRG
jgi:hypothetical protein